MSAATTARQSWGLLTKAEQRQAGSLLVLMLAGMVAEALSIGLLIPAFGLLKLSGSATNVTFAAPALDWLQAKWLGVSIPTIVLPVVVLVYAGKSFLLILLARREGRFAFGVRSRLSEQLFAGYLHQPYSFHLLRNSAQLIRNALTNVGAFAQGGLLAAMTLVAECLVLVGICSVLVALDAVAAVTALTAFGAAGWGLHRLTNNKVHRAGVLSEYHDGMRIQYLQEGLAAVKEAKLLGREAEFVRIFSLHSEAAAHAEVTYFQWQQTPRLALEFFAVLLLVGLVGESLLRGHSPADVALMVGLFAAAAFRLMPSVNRILTSLQTLRYCAPHIASLHEHAAVPPAMLSSESGAGRLQFAVALALRDVTFTYPGALHAAAIGTSLTIAPHETIGIVGASGAGKSTLVDLLLGLLTPDAGDILVDGRDIQLSLRDWQNQIGYVPQTIFLTDDTIRNNVAFGVASGACDESAVWKALEAAQLAVFVRNLPLGLETQVGERGVRLSGGQRQRVGIARALYHDPAVLVLDEATNALDLAMEEEVMAAIRSLRGTRAIVIVAHRASTVRSCDRVYRMDSGRLAPEGPPSLADRGDRG